MNDRGSDSPEPVWIIFFAADASRRLRRCVCFGVKSTSITWLPDVLGDFLVSVPVSAPVLSIVSVSAPVLHMSVPDSLLLSELSSKFLSLV
jgi:hypothetical protein